MSVEVNCQQMSAAVPCCLNNLFIRPNKLLAMSAVGLVLDGHVNLLPCVL